mgnify:CR=1 FL=1
MFNPFYDFHAIPDLLPGSRPKSKPEMTCFPVYIDFGLPANSTFCPGLVQIVGIDHLGNRCSSRDIVTVETELLMDSCGKASGIKSFLKVQIKITVDLSFDYEELSLLIGVLLKFFDRNNRAWQVVELTDFFLLTRIPR